MPLVWVSRSRIVYRPWRWNQDATRRLFRLLDRHPDVAKLRKVFFHRIVERQLSFVDQDRDGHRRDRLRHGSDPEEMVHPHGLTSLETAATDRAEVEDVLTVGHEA